MLRTAKKKPAIVAVIMNLQRDGWMGPMADQLLDDPKARAAVIAAVVDQADKNAWAGICFDFEDI